MYRNQPGSGMLWMDHHGKYINFMLMIILRKSVREETHVGRLTMSSRMTLVRGRLTDIRIKVWPSNAPQHSRALC